MEPIDLPFLIKLLFTFLLITSWQVEGRRMQGPDTSSEDMFNTYPTPSQQAQSRDIETFLPSMDESLGKLYMFIKGQYLIDAFC